MKRAKVFAGTRSEDRAGVIGLPAPLTTRSSPVDTQETDADPEINVTPSRTPVVTSGRVADGWRVEMVPVRGHTEDVAVAPTGERYVRAAYGETPDLIYQSSTPGLGPWRLRLEKRSRRARTAKKDAAAQKKERTVTTTADPSVKPKRVRRKQ